MAWPCGMRQRPPSEWPMACTMPTMAFENAAPAISEASARLVRASVSAPEALDRAFLDELTALNDLFHREYGVPLTLSELGVSRDDLPAVAKQARYDGAALYNETEITLEDAMAVLEAAY